MTQSRPLGQGPVRGQAVLVKVLARRVVLLPLLLLLDSSGADGSGQVWAFCCGRSPPGWSLLSFSAVVAGPPGGSSGL